jgi:hypothetical protein
MTVALVILAVLALAAVVATIVAIARDGYRRIPTRPGYTSVSKISDSTGSAESNSATEPMISSGRKGYFSISA